MDLSPKAPKRELIWAGEISGNLYRASIIEDAGVLVESQVDGVWFAVYEMPLPDRMKLLAEVYQVGLIRGRQSAQPQPA